MRLARFKYGDKIETGRVEGQTIITETDEYQIEEVEILAPVRPRKVIGAGRQFPEIREKYGRTKPEKPFLFFKSPTSIIGPNAMIVDPTDDSHPVVHEGELAFIISKECKNINADDASDYIKGYTCINDITAKEWGEHDNGRVRSKGSDTFAPLGPFIQTDIEVPPKLTMSTRVNGQLIYEINTDEMTYSVGEILEEITKYVTLEEDDVVATGAPEVAPLNSGDEVEVFIETVGTLKNTVK